ncbi:MAG: cellobiose phosphorylase, partial [Candidatus Omnitrophica bacterium]|nr:cellobiose phosphorylase [Candidatus Omnitrophota bacterium]
MGKTWNFKDILGAFEFPEADKIRSLYFPLCNQALMSSLSPDLHGDIKSGQNSFLLEPVSRINLNSLRASRNFWVYIGRDKVWSATGVSKNLKQIQEDSFTLRAGLLWQKITRENKKIGLKAEILSFIPASAEPVEIMQVKFTNISAKKIKFIPSAAIPLYARSADNIRDHRQVTSLLQRITLNKYGVVSRPTLVFDEAGHRPNQEYYFVLGIDAKGHSPQYIYPTQEMFCGEAGDLEAPEAVLKNLLPSARPIQGREPMGALRFREASLKPGTNYSYGLIMGITREAQEIRRCLNKFNSAAKIEASLKQTRAYWQSISRSVNISSANFDFDRWFSWVNIQPVLRKTFGCSFLPDFDYGKGGRGWRDLWQDGLGLLLNDPKEARTLLLNNFCGVRIDGSNATIVGKKPGEFIADRNAISRVWMDHGVWPLITTDLYINETGDAGILFKEAGYFCDQHTWRSAKINRSWCAGEGHKLKTITGKIYRGSVYEHLLLQNLIQFFNVGPHNHIRLEGADWNDGLDMAQKFGESVAFSAMYAWNLSKLAELLLKTGRPNITLAKEMKILLRHFDYGNKKEKHKILEQYFTKTEKCLSGKKISVATAALARNLKIKSLWMQQHIRKTEWLNTGFFNGYYDNKQKRVEGKVNGLLRMCLASQVFPLMSGVADKQQASEIIKSVNRYLLDKKLKGYHLNTDFKASQPDLGRAFSFAYGDKENGAIFSHMVVMYAYALYARSFVQEGWKVLSSLYGLSANIANSRIYPCLPEYFNAQGQGMYAYLTGSASWFILTLITQAFGVRGEDGDLLIEPKLTAGQFEGKSTLSITRSFSGVQVQVNISNPKRLDYGKYRILKAFLNSRPLALAGPQRIRIKRKALTRKT